MGVDAGKRHERLVRLLTAARHLKRIQQQRLRESEAALRELQERREALLKASESGRFDTAGLARLLRRNLDEAVRRSAEVRRRREQDAAVLRSRHMQVKQIERMRHDALRGMREERRKAELLEILERVVGGREEE